MLLLATQAQPQMRDHRHPNLGRLVQPRHYPRIARPRALVCRGRPTTTRSTAGTTGRARFRRMVDAISGLPGGLFIGGATMLPLERLSNVDV